MICRAIYNLLIESNKIKETIGKNGNEYAIFTYSRPKNINYPAIVFRLEPYKIKTEIETNELTIELYTEGKNVSENYSLANTIVDQLDKKIILYPNDIELRLYLASEIGYQTTETDGLTLIKLKFLIRGPISRWGVK